MSIYMLVPTIFNNYVYKYLDPSIQLQSTYTMCHRSCFPNKSQIEINLKVIG